MTHRLTGTVPPHPFTFNYQLSHRKFLGMLVRPFATYDYVNRDPETVSWSQTGASMHAYEKLFCHFPLRLSSALPFSESDKDTSAEYYPPDCRGAPLYIKPSHTAHTHTCTHAHTPSWFSSTLPLFVFFVSFLLPMHRSTSVILSLFNQIPTLFVFDYQLYLATFFFSFFYSYSSFMSPASRPGGPG